MYSDYNDHHWPGSPIQISADQYLFTAPRSFSQCITSFVASDCQGIHQMPLPIAWFLQYKYFTIYIFSTKNLTFLPAILANFGVYFYTSFYLDFSVISYSHIILLQLLSLFTMFYNYPKKRWPFLVEVRRIELLTPCLQSRCSPSWAIPPHRFYPCRYQAFYLRLLRRNFWTPCRNYYISEEITSKNPNKKIGGSGKTWTSDLTLIRRTL